MANFKLTNRQNENIIVGSQNSYTIQINNTGNIFIWCKDIQINTNIRELGYNDIKQAETELLDLMFNVKPNEVFKLYDAKKNLLICGLVNTVSYNIENENITIFNNSVKILTSVKELGYTNSTDAINYLDNLLFDDTIPSTGANPDNPKIMPFIADIDNNSIPINTRSTLLLNGINFSPNSVVLTNNEFEITYTYINPMLISVDIITTDAIGTYDITVTNGLNSYTFVDAYSVTTVTTENVVWKNVTSNLTVIEDGRLKRNNSYGWNSSANSTRAILSNSIGSFEFVPLNPNNRYMVAFRYGSDGSGTYKTLQYAFYVASSNRVYIYMNGQRKTGPYYRKAGDILKCTISNKVINFYINDTVIYTTKYNGDVGELYIDTVLYDRYMELPQISITGDLINTTIV
jgi:hypothetical protein